MDAAANGNGYSSNVRLQLIVGDRLLEVSQVAPNWCILREPIDHPPCEAEMVLQINGHRQSRKVRLSAGNSKSSNRAEFG